MSATVIAFSNLKGGVGKTTTANSFAAGLTRRGYMDPQGNLTASCGANVDENSPTILEVMKRKEPITAAIQHMPAFDIIPTDVMLSGYEMELIATLSGRETKLVRALAPAKDMYDYIFIDTAPALGMLTINALTAADEVIAPSFAEFFSVSGIELLVDTIRNVRAEAGNSNLRLDGILMTQVNPRTLNAQAVIEETQKYIDYLAVPRTNEYGDPVEPIHTKIYKTYIRRGVAMGESQTAQEDIFTYNPKSTVAKDYDNFVVEYLTEHGKELNVNA